MKKVRITDQYVRRAAHIIDEAGMASHIDDLLARAPQGRKRRISVRTILIGMYLSVEHAGSFKSTDCFEVLRRGISIEMQFELGSRWTTETGTGHIKKSHIDQLMKDLSSRGYFTDSERALRGEVDTVDDAELARRAAVVQQLVDDLLDASIVDKEGSGWFALDGSGLWAHGRSPRLLGGADDVRADEQVIEDPQADWLIDEHGDARGPDGRRRVYADVDAAEGVKTAHRGGREHYFGYVLDAAVRTAKPGGAAQPVVAEAIVVSPASTDVVGPSLAMLDSLKERGRPVTDITVDRHYSHKAEHRWAAELRTRKIRQTLDLRSDDQRVSDHDGIKILAGQAYCPTLPPELENIPKPGLNASNATWQTFRQNIERREAFALKFHERPNLAGRARVQCAAMAGQGGCPLRDGTVDAAVSAGLPVFRDPPPAERAPGCCTNTTGVVAITSRRLNKLAQPYAWGTRPWEKAYNLRTYVEGYFGSLKNDDAENLGRGQSKFTGLLRVTLQVAISTASCNVRHQAKFYADDPVTHPLLEVRDEDDGWSSAAAT
jgi:hypothetical protein